MKIETIMARLATGQVISGIENCHLPNVDSIVVRQRINEREGMIRIFFARQGHPLKEMFSEAGDFACLPHDHRQAITIAPLFGSIYNHRFLLPHQSSSGSLGWPVKTYVYDSPLLDGAGNLRQCEAVFETLIYSSRQKLDRHQEMTAATVHTMTVSSPSAAWVVIEGEQRRTGNPTCYSLVHGKKIDTTGLYTPMSHSVLAERCAMLLRHIAGGAA
jgi:hypothetical protein